MPTNPTIAEEAVKHTPGPWTKRGTDVYGAGCLISRAPSVGTVAGSTVAGQIAYANARLIAAAPDLLAAAKAALVYDAAIRRRGFIGKGLEPAPGLPGALATGADLDALYWDWQEKSAAAVAKADGAK